MNNMLYKIKKTLFVLKGKIIGYSPSKDYENYKKYFGGIKWKKLKDI